MLKKGEITDADARISILDGYSSEEFKFYYNMVEYYYK